MKIKKFIISEGKFKNILYSLKIFVLIILLTTCERNSSSLLGKGLLGYWPLKNNANDNSGNGRNALERGNLDYRVAGPEGIAGSATGFNGLNSFLEIPADKLTGLGKEDFSISAWINTSNKNEDVPGDIVSKYDPVNHRGFQLSIKTNAVTTSQTNALQINFGIDNDKISEWIDCGRPGNAVCAFSMASYQGDLYAGTCEAGKTESGHVYRYNGLDRWIDCGAPDSSNSVMALAVFNNKLYAGTAKYRLAGSSLTESENPYLGGRIFSYEGEQNWRYCGQLPETETTGGLIVYKGALYASSMYHPAGFFRYEGDTTWTDCGTPDGKRVVALAVYNGFIWASSYDGGFVYRYDGNSWTDCGRLGDNTQTYSFTVYRGRLFVGTWPSGRVYRFEDINRWTDMGRLGNELEVMGMIVHNGRLVAGTLPLAEIYSYEGDTVWTKITRLDHTPDVRYRRAWIMAEHDGRIFCSTLPSGKIYSCEFGKSVLSDNPVTPGWHHIAAVRSTDHLILYLDGKELARSEPFNPELYDLTNDEPLWIGFGPNDYFNGSLVDLRFYNRSLDVREIRWLSDYIY